MKYIQLTQGYQAIVDDADYDELSKHKWCVRKSKNKVYATRSTEKNGIRKTLYMHRLIMNNPTDGKIVDHIDRNTLNNQRENLRIVTYTQNNVNRYRKSGGLYQDKKSGKWRGSIKKDRKSYHTKYTDDKEKAMIEYKILAKSLHGEYVNV